MPSHHNKQTTEAEAPTDAWVLGPYEKQKQVINDAKKKVKETEGESNKMLNDLLEQTLYYDESVMERRLKEILSLVINPRTGKFWDISTLQHAGKLSDAEAGYIRAQHQGREPPFYYIYQIQRKRDDQHKEWLIANIMFEGIDKDGQRVNRGWRRISQYSTITMEICVI
jgi:hypothetical protein